MTLICLKGNEKLGLVKGRVYPVLKVTELGKEGGYQARVVLQLTDRKRTLYVPSVHRGRMYTKAAFNVNNGSDPTSKARVQFQTEVESDNEEFQDVRNPVG